MDNVEKKIRKGQAMNLAVADALNKGKSDDVEYIYKRGLYYLEIINAFQQATIEDLQDILK